MRFIPLKALALSGVAFLPLVTYAAGSFFGPIIPQEGVCVCPGSAPQWGCTLEVLQRVINLGISLGIVVITLYIAYAGFQFMIHSTNPGARAKARQGIWNALIGLALVLSSWVIVDFVMKVLYEPNTEYLSVKFGPWNSILSPAADGSDKCLTPRNPTPITVGSVVAVVTSVTPGTGIGEAKAPCADNNPACSIPALKAQGLSDSQAQAMSCIAMTESSGNPNTPNSKTGACGTFQITTQPGNWHNPAYHQGSCTVNTSCNNASCNMQTAVIMFNKQKSYQPWTGKNPDGSYWNPNAVACVAKYDPNGHI